MKRKALEMSPVAGSAQVAVEAVAVVIKNPSFTEVP
jgi:hypothetical protein